MIIKINKKTKSLSEMYDLFSRFSDISLVNSPGKYKWSAFEDMLSAVQDEFVKLMVLHDQLPDFNNDELKNYLEIITDTSKKLGLIDVYFSPETVLELKEKGLIGYIL